MGAITSSSVAALGSGYTAGDKLFITGGGGIAVALIQTVGAGGVPATYLLPSAGAFADSGGNQLVERGCGYSIASNVPTTGGSGSGFTIDILAVGPGTNATHGTINGTSLGSGGAGYAAGDSGVFVQGANQSGTYVVLTVDGGGGVVTWTPDPADGYAVGLTTTATGAPQPGSGSGFTMNIASISPCGGVLSGYRNRFYVAK